MSLSTSNHSSLETTVKDVVPSLASSFGEETEDTKKEGQAIIKHQNEKLSQNSTLSVYNFLLLTSLSIIIVHLVHSSGPLD